MLDIVLLTESKYINTTPAKDDWYTKNVLRENQLAKQALEDQALNVAIKDWQDPFFDWSEPTAVVFRTTWDYLHKLEAFKTWLKEVKDKTQLINSYELIQWNLDKHYLLDIEKKGINIPQSIFIHSSDLKKDNVLTLEKIAEVHDLGNFVLKPCISGAGRHTYHINKEDIGQYGSLFRELLEKEDLLIQPFLESIRTQGEVAYMIFGGEYTHAVHKKAKDGEFRVQDDFGGTVSNYEPTQEEIDFAVKAVKAIRPLPPYARVDVIKDNDGKLCVSELELIEPELWFRQNPDSAEKFAEAIVEAMGLYAF